jgi:type IV pilus assembly protein PilA
MFMAIRERLERGREEGGFTLIELMVVVLIIAILIAIAIPTFLGARKRAQDKQAQSNLRNALTAEKTYYVDNQAYTATVADLQDIESALNFASADASARGVLPFVVAGDDQVVILQSASKSGTTFCLADIAGLADAGTYYAKACTGAETRAAVAAWDKTTVGWS